MDIRSLLHTIQIQANSLLYTLHSNPKMCSVYLLRENISKQNLKIFHNSSSIISIFPSDNTICRICINLLLFKKGLNPILFRIQIFTEMDGLASHK